MNLLDELESYLKSRGMLFYKNFDLKYQTYFKTGGIVRLYVCPSSVDQLVCLVNLLVEKKIPYKIIGGTTNIIFLNEAVYSVIISTKLLSSIHVKGTFVEVESGYSLSEFVRVCLINGLTGCEGLEGIPGSIGGAIFMNAGAYGYNISDQLLSVKFINSDGNISSLSKSDCGFEYRKSLFRENPELTIIGAKFNFVVGGKDDIAKEIETYHIARHLYQEWAYPNLGSMISLNKDIYSKIYGNDIRYRMIHFLLKLLLNNPLSKFIRRRKPNSLIFNRLLMSYIESLGGDVSLKRDCYAFSRKSANILINNGEYEDIDFINHVSDMSKLSDSEEVIENEFVTFPVLNMSSDLRDVFLKRW